MTKQERKAATRLNESALFTAETLELFIIVYSFVSTRLDCCNSVLYGVADNQLQRLQSVQNAAARLVTGTRRSEHITPVLQSLHMAAC